MKIIAIIAWIAVLGLPATAKVADEQPIFVSLIRLIAAPQEYAGRRVAIVGFLHLEFEGDGIYLHRDDYEHSQTKNGLWVVVSGESAKQLRAAADQYVLLEGTFIPDRHGHMGLWSGTLAQITRAQVWKEGPAGRKK
jgi:hypothetical protein